MNILTRKILRDDWSEHAEAAHKAMFDRIRRASTDRSDYTIFAYTPDEPLGYVTVRELDSESVYWQFGGAFPHKQKTINVLPIFRALLDAQLVLGAKRVTNLIVNENIAYIKLCLHCGFKIIGTRYYGGDVLVELMKEF